MQKVLKKHMKDHPDADLFSALMLGGVESGGSVARRASAIQEAAAESATAAAASAQLEKDKELLEKENDTMGFEPNPTPRQGVSPAAVSSSLGAGTSSATSQPAYEPEEEVIKPVKLTKAQKMLGMTAEHVQESVRIGAGNHHVLPDSSVGSPSTKKGLFGGLFGGGNKPAGMLGASSRNVPASPSGVGSSTFRTTSRLMPIMDEEDGPGGRSSKSSQNKGGGSLRITGGKSLKNSGSAGSDLAAIDESASAPAAPLSHLPAQTPTVTFDPEQQLKLDIKEAEIELKIVQETFTKLNDTKVNVA
jgi:hypothetical protein